MINESKKNKYKIINVFDFVLILLILFLVLCAYINVSKNRISNLLVDETKSEITLTVMRSENNSKLFIKPQDKLYFETTNDYLGTVKSISPIYNSTYKVYKNAGIAKRSFTDEIIGFSVKLDVPIKSTARGSFVNESIFIAPGSELDLYIEEKGAFSANVNNITIHKSK